MIIGKASCYDLMLAVHALSLVNFILIIALGVITVIYFRKLLKDNGILAKMIHRISGDLPE